MGTGVPVLDREALLASAQTLGPLPSTAQRLVGIVADPDHDVREVVEVVSLDPRFAAALLRRTNAGSGAHRVATIREAAMLLGPGALLSTALATVVSGPMTRAVPALGLARGGLWRQAVTASLAADVVRTAANVAVPAEVTVAALLHDVGLLVLSEHVPSAILARVRELAGATGQGLVEAERTLLGVEHAEIGAIVARHWRLPDTVVAAIAHHHEPGDGLPPASAATSLAHRLALAVPHAGGQEPDATTTEPAVGALASLGLDPARFLGLVVLTRRRCAE
ncbi:MAG: HDOD domain-containing protein, partial [Nocardioidaceae bacterium]